MKLEGGPAHGKEVGNPPALLYQVPEMRLSDWDIMDPRTTLGHYLGDSLRDINDDPIEWFVAHTYRRDGDRFVWDHVSPDPPHWVGPMPPVDTETGEG